MPIYEYHCDACGRTSSFLLLRVSEELTPYCKGCGSKDVQAGDLAGSGIEK